MPVYLGTSYVTGRSLFGLLRRMSDGFLWSVAATAWEAAPSLANRKISLVEGSSEYTGRYGPTSISGLGDAAIVEFTVHDDADADDKTIAGPMYFYVKGGEELPLPVNAIQWAGTATVASDYATAANQTTILNRIGAFTGSGLNTILGFFRALLRKDAALTPSDVGGTFDNTTDSTEAIRDRGDAAWTTSTFTITAAAIADAVWDEARADHATAGSFGQGVASVQGNVTGSVASVTADVGITQAGADKVWGSAARTLTAFGFTVTVSAIQADVVTASALAADAANEIADAVLSRNVSNVENTAPEHSLCTLVLAGLESSVSGTSWVIRKTGGTVLYTKTVTLDSAAIQMTGVT